jgi:exosortase
MPNLTLVTLLFKKKKNLTILGLILLAAGFFSSSIHPLLQRWLKLNQDLSHGLPTLLIFIFFIWQASPIQSERDSRKIYGLICAALTFFSFVWYLFQSINIELPSVLLLLLALALYLAACFSLKTMKDLLPFFMLFVFAIPIFAELNDQLVKLSSVVVGTWIDAIQLTAVIEGNNILIPSGRITIADGCSGLRYLNITVLLAYIICLLNGYNLRQSLLALACATGLGLLVNWIRIFLLVLIGYHSNMQSKLMHDHEIFGWVLFIAIIMPAIYWAPIIRKNMDFRIRIPKCKPLFPTLCLALGPVLFVSTHHNELSSNTLSLNNLTIAPLAHKSKLGVPITLNVRSEKITQYYDSDGITFQLDLAKFTPSSAAEKLVPYIPNLHPKDDWIAADQQPTITPKEFAITILKNVNSPQKMLLLYQFNVGHNATGSYRFAKLLQLKAKFLGQNFFGLFAIQANCKTDCAEEIQAVKKITGNWQRNKFNALNTHGTSLSTD